MMGCLDWNLCRRSMENIQSRMSCSSDRHMPVCHLAYPLLARARADETAYHNVCDDPGLAGNDEMSPQGYTHRHRLPRCRLAPAC